MKRMLRDKITGPIPAIRTIFKGERPKDLKKTKLPC
jgi:hypothetical protein